MRHFHSFDKIDSFLKNISNVLDSKKVDYIFEEPLYIQLLVIYRFLSSVVGSRRTESQAEETI